MVIQAQSEQHVCEIQREERAWRPPPWHYSFPGERSAAGVPKPPGIQSSGRCNSMSVWAYWEIEEMGRGAAVR